MHRTVKVLFTLALFCLFNAKAESHWNLLESTENTLNDILAVNDNTLIAIGNGGAIWKSSNQGSTWTSQSSGTSSNLLKIKSHNSLLFVLTEDGDLLTSSNGGNTWSSQNLHTSALFDIDFQGSNGIIVGAQGFVFVSTNNGSAWSNAGQQSIFNLNSVLFVNDTLSVAIGSGGVALKSIDNGTTWSESNLPSSESFSSITKDPFRNRVIAVGTNGTQAVYGINSNTWSISTISENWLKDKHCNNDNTCYAVGFNSTVLIYTSSSPTSVPMQQEENINAIVALSDVIAFVVTTSGNIYKTETGAFLVNTAERAPIEFSIYPNPFQNTLSIEGLQSTIAFQIFDISGKLMVSGQTQGIINTEPLGPGTYFLVFETEKGFQRETIIKQ